MAKGDHPTVPPAYPTFRSRAYPAMHKVTMRQDCKSASQHRRALCPRDTVRHISKKSAKQQSKGLYLASANKGGNGLGPSRPPCQLDGKIHALLHRTIFMENTKDNSWWQYEKSFQEQQKYKSVKMVKKRTIIDIVRWILHKNLSTTIRYIVSRVQQKKSSYKHKSMQNVGYVSCDTLQQKERGEKFV